MKQAEVMQVIQGRMNFRENNTKYDGFDMSGYNNSNYSNLELLARFKDLMDLNCDKDNRKSDVHLPIFWKGSGKIVKVSFEGELQTVKDITGWGTADILSEIISLQNPKLLN